MRWLILLSQMVAFSLIAVAQSNVGSDAASGAFDELFKDVPVCKQSVASMAGLIPFTDAYNKAASECLDAGVKQQKKLKDGIDTAVTKLKTISTDKQPLARSLLRFLMEHETVISSELRLLTEAKAGDEMRHLLDRCTASAP